MLEVVTLTRALEIITENVVEHRESENVDFPTALNRVLAEDVRAVIPMPTFNRSAMDGYAVWARDTFGASESMPALLTLAGEVPMGESPKKPLSPGEAVAVATGAMLPEVSDAVSMVEYSEKLDAFTLAVYRPVGPGENILHRGDDVAEGDVLFQAGEVVSPRHIAVLAAQGIATVSVLKRPVVGIISTGNELVPTQETPGPGEIRDVNSHALAALLRETGATPRLFGIVPDDATSLKKVFTTALKECRMILVSGGSSVGLMDVTAKVISSLGQPGLLFHGVSMRPGKPTIFGIVEGIPIFGLSGNPASAMLTFMLLVQTALQHRFGLPGAHRGFIQARLDRSLASAQGREDFVRVALKKGDGDSVLAEPLFGPAGFLTPLAKAQGIIRIHQNAEGLKEGEEVEVTLL